MNIEEQRAHYAAVKSRLVPKAAPVTRVERPPKIEQGTTRKEQRHVAMLMYGLPIVSPSIRASVSSILLAYNVSWVAVVGRGRRHRVCMCRRAVTWLLHTRGWSYPKIGELMRRDHSTCVYAVHRANSWQYPNDNKIKRGR
jgi:hypothetical protein